MIQQISDKWKPSRSVPFISNHQNSCNGLGNAIEELEESAGRLPEFVDPLANISSSQRVYERFLNATGDKYCDKKFWSIVREVSALHLQRAPINSLLSFINLQPEKIEGPVKRQFAENVIKSLAAANFRAIRDSRSSSIRPFSS